MWNVSTIDVIMRKDYRYSKVTGRKRQHAILVEREKDVRWQEQHLHKHFLFWFIDKDFAKRPKFPFRKYDYVREATYIMRQKYMLAHLGWDWNKADAFVMSMQPRKVHVKRKWKRSWKH